MQRSLAEIYFHFVWTTKNRQPWLRPEVERAIHRCIEAEVVGLRASVLGIGGMEDHVHLVVRTPTNVSAAQLMQKAKGVSSHFVHDQLRGLPDFDWQDNYGVFSISRSHVRRVVAYARDQKRHHGDGTMWPEWEKPYEIVPRPEDD